MGEPLSADVLSVPWKDSSNSLHCRNGAQMKVQVNIEPGQGGLNSAGKNEILRAVGGEDDFNF